MKHKIKRDPHTYHLKKLKKKWQLEDWSDLVIGFVWGALVMLGVMIWIAVIFCKN